MTYRLTADRSTTELLRNQKKVRALKRSTTEFLDLYFLL